MQILFTVPGIFIILFLVFAVKNLIDHKKLRASAYLGLVILNIVATAWAYKQVDKARILGDEISACELALELYVSDIRERIENSDAETVYLYISLINNEDPSEWLLQELTSEKVIVKNFSDSKLGDELMVLDVDTGKQGIRLSVSGIDWINDDEIVVHLHVLASGGIDYRFVRKNDSWSFKSKELTYVS